MAKFFGNLHLVLLTGVAFALGVMFYFAGASEGVLPVNSTSVLVLAYTLGGVLAPALGAAMLDWAPVVGFPALLLAVAGPGWWLLRRANRAV